MLDSSGKTEKVLIGNVIASLEMVRPYILLFFILFMVAKAKKASSVGKIRIIVQAFEHRMVDDAVGKIIATIKDSGATIAGPVPLPTKIEKITVNRSTFVNKDAREQFEIRRHKRLIDVLESNPQTLEMLQSINIPSGVGVEVKVL